MKNILIATDLTIYSDRALERAVRIANLHEAALHMLHVVPIYKNKELRRKTITLKEDVICKYLKSFKILDNTETTAEVTENDIVHFGIREYADRIKADLIVLGIHRAKKFKDIFMGTTVQCIAKNSAYPVLMVRDKAVAEYKHVLAGIDYSFASKQALRLAYKLAPTAEFKLFHAYNMPTLYGTNVDYAAETYKQLQKENVSMMEDFLQKELAFIRKKNKKSIKITSKITKDVEKYGILREAKGLSSDLIALGAHGCSSIMPGKLGGVAGSLINKAPCDILLAR